MIAGLFLVIGAALAFIFNLTLEARKQRTTTLTRWDDEIRKNVADVLRIHYAVGKLWAQQVLLINNLWFEVAVKRNELPGDKLAELESDTKAAEDWNDAQFRIKQMTSKDWNSNSERAAAYQEELYSLQAKIAIAAPPELRSATEALIDKLQISSYNDFDRYERYAETKALAETLASKVRKHLKVPT